MLQLLPQRARGRHHHRRAGRGPRSPEPQAKVDPSSGCPSEPSEAQALAHPLRPLVPVQPHRARLKLGSGLPAAPRRTGTYVQTHLVGPGVPGHILCCQNLDVPTSALTAPSLTSLILATPGVGRHLGQASACGSPGHKKQARDRSTEFFKALMEPASPDLGPGTQAISQGPLPQHCSCFLFQL